MKYAKSEQIQEDYFSRCTRCFGWYTGCSSCTQIMVSCVQWTFCNAMQLCSWAFCSVLYNLLPLYQDHNVINFAEQSLHWFFANQQSFQVLSDESILSNFCWCRVLSWTPSPHFQHQKEKKLAQPSRNIFRCASISWFEIVSQWLIHFFFTASASTGLSDYFGYFIAPKRIFKWKYCQKWISKRIGWAPSLCWAKVISNESMDSVDSKVI